MIHACSFTEPGADRPNEDAFLVQHHPSDPDCWLVLVADGQGGRAGGARAAHLACQTALEAALACAPGSLLDPLTWAAFLGKADQAVSADPEAGFTTLVGLCVLGHRVAGASSGDSAALLLHGSQTKVLTACQHKNPPVGSGGAAFVPFVYPLQTPWQLLTMTDGVWKYVGWDRIITLARGEQRWRLLDALAEPARLRGSGRFQDDFTVVLLEG